jgi:hypothetical protein
LNDTLKDKNQEQKAVVLRNAQMPHAARAAFAQPIYFKCRLTQFCVGATDISCAPDNESMEFADTQKRRAAYAVTGLNDTKAVCTLTGPILSRLDRLIPASFDWINHQTSKRRPTDARLRVR